MKKTIAIIEDDATLRSSLVKAFEDHGYAARAITDFAQATSIVLSLQPALVLLDLGLPGTDGALIARTIKTHEKGKNIPIIVLTSKTGERDEIISMSMGADDFLTKPFSLNILLAHIEAVLRRYNLYSPSEDIVYGELLFSPSKGIVARKNASSTQQDTEKAYELTRNEHRILSCLLKHKGEKVSRQTLMCALWDSESFVDDNALTVNVNRLRKLLEQAGLKDYIKTHRGEGYSLQA